MVSKSFIAYTLLLSFTTLVDAHAAVNQPLGVQGQATRNDVQNPTAQKPCGNVNIAQTFDTSKTVPVNANGSVSTTITDFNGGADGSRKIQTVKVDPSGTGNNFVAATMLVNGDPAPANVGTEPIVFQLPAGTTCTGGATKDKCLVSLITTAGFGNCIVAQDSTNSGNNAKGQTQDNATKNTVGTNNASNTTTGDNGTSDNKTGKNNKGKDCKGNNNKGNTTTADNTTTGNNSTDTKTGDKKKGDTTTIDNSTSNNSTNTKTGDKKGCDEAKTKASRRSSLDRIASFKRSWSSREWVKAL